MKELNSHEIDMVSGGWFDIEPMDVAISYSSTAIGAGVGLTIAGPVGGIVGAAVGFGTGLAMSVGYSMATGPGGAYRDNGMVCYTSI